MNIKFSVYTKIATFVTAFFTIAGVVLRTVLMLSFYNGDDGFYTNGTLHLVFRYMLIVFAAVAFAAAYIYIKEGKSQISQPLCPLVRKVSLIPACVFTSFLIYTFAKVVIPTLNAPTVADLFMALFAIAAILYFFSLNSNSKLGDASAILCAAPALVLLVLVFGLYFNPTVSYINHSIILCYAASIFLMLATVAEANAFLGRPFLHRYLAYAPTAVVLSFSLAIPDIVYALTALKAPLTDVFYDVIILTLGIYHLIKLAVTAFYSPKEEQK